MTELMLPLVLLLKQQYVPNQALPTVLSLKQRRYLLLLQQS